MFVGPDKIFTPSPLTTHTHPLESNSFVDCIVKAFIKQRRLLRYIKSNNASIMFTDNSLSLTLLPEYILGQQCPQRSCIYMYMGTLFYIYFTTTATTIVLLVYMYIYIYIIYKTTRTMGQSPPPTRSVDRLCTHDDERVLRVRRKVISAPEANTYT